MLANLLRPFQRRLVSDCRGVAAMEAGILGLFIIALLLPISDVAAAALTYMRTYQAMRNVAAAVAYNPPPDLNSPTTAWNSLPTTMSGYTITAKLAPTSPPPASRPGASVPIYITVLCGDPSSPLASCPSDATTPKWYYLVSNVQLTPMFLTGLTGGPLTYVQQFQ